jgi:hypothetical protein
MAKHRVTIGIGDQHFALLEQIGSVSSRQPGDVAKDMLVEILDGMQSMFDSCEGSDTNESSNRKMFRVGINRMIDALDDAPK